MALVSDFKQTMVLTNFSDFNRLSFFNSFKYIISFSFFLVSGLPPFLLFLYKYMLLTQILSSGYFIVIIFIILMNVLSLSYYLKIIKTILFEESNVLAVNKLSYVNNTLNKNLINEKSVLLEFSLYLLFIIFFSIALFVYFGEIETFLTDNSKNFLSATFIF